jgi:Holliday junction DNA helicase RuvA
VRDGDLATLTRVPRVGKKLAERLVLELRDKLEGEVGAGAAGAAAVAGPAMAAMAAAPPALPAPPQGLPPLPYPCFGFGTPIPFVGFSTGC